jgi:hypothetical protein
MAGLKSSAPGGTSQPVKRSCCSHNATANAGAAVGGASPPPGLSWALPSPSHSAAATPPPGLQSAAAAAGGVTAMTSPSPHKQAAASPAAAAVSAAAGGGASAGSSSSSVAADCMVQLQRLGALLLPSGEMPGEVGLVLTGGW